MADLPEMKGKLAAIFDDLESRPDVRAALTEHLLGGTPASQLARDLTESGWPISATTIKEFRQTSRDLTERSV